MRVMKELVARSNRHAQMIAVSMALKWAKSPRTVVPVSAMLVGMGQLASHRFLVLLAIAAPTASLRAPFQTTIVPASAITVGEVIPVSTRFRATLQLSATAMGLQLGMFMRMIAPATVSKVGPEPHVKMWKLAQVARMEVLQLVMPLRALVVVTVHLALMATDVKSTIMSGDIAGAGVRGCCSRTTVLEQTPGNVHLW